MVIIFELYFHRFSAYVTRENDEGTCQTFNVTSDWLKEVLIPKLVNWCQVENLTTETKSLKLVSVDAYALKYQYLKEKHGPRLIEVSVQHYHQFISDL